MVVSAVLFTTLVLKQHVKGVDLLTQQAWLIVVNTTENN